MPLRLMVLLRLSAWYPPRSSWWSRCSGRRCWWRSRARRGMARRCSSGGWGPAHRSAPLLSARTRNLGRRAEPRGVAWDGPAQLAVPSDNTGPGCRCAPGSRVRAPLTGAPGRALLRDQARFACARKERRTVAARLAQLTAPWGKAALWSAMMTVTCYATSSCHYRDGQCLRRIRPPRKVAGSGKR